MRLSISKASLPYKLTSLRRTAEVSSCQKSLEESACNRSNPLVPATDLKRVFDARGHLHTMKFGCMYNSSVPCSSHSLTKLLLPHFRHPLTVQARTFFRPVLDSRELGSVNLFDIKRYLRQKHVEFQESHACLAIQVPKHILSGKAASTKWKSLDESISVIFINKTTGSFVCPELALGGPWTTLKEFLSLWCQSRSQKAPLDVPKLETIIPSHIEGIEAWTKAEPIEALEASQFRAVLKAMRLPVREFKLEHFVRFEAKVANAADIETSPSNIRLLFPVRYMDGQMIGIRQLYVCESTGETKEETLCQPLSSSSPYACRVVPFPHGLHWAHAAHATSVILVSSILDSISLIAKTSGAALFPVALAEGVTSLPPDQLPFFENFAVNFWFPNTGASFEAMRAFSKKLGEAKCSVVSRDTPQPWVWSKQKKDVDIMAFLRQNSRACSHEYITTFESLREDVYLEFAQHEEVAGIQWKRFDQMNEILKGFRRGELTIFSGRTGSGKTTFMSEFSLDLCNQGVSTLWGSFEVKNTRLAKMQLKQNSGVVLEDHLDQFNKHADQFQKLPMYYLTFHGAQEVEKVLDAMGHAVYIYDIAHVIIDNIQFMMGMQGKPLDRFYLQDMIIQKFRKFATLHNVHVTLVIHPRKEDADRLTTNSIFGGAKATQEADNVILLQEEDLNVKLKRKFIQVVKNRFSGDLGYVPLFFNKGTLTFSKKIFQQEKKKQKKPAPPVIDDILGNEILIPPEEHLES